ncbi:MAG: AI-2E family transporter [Verrucomicrobiota bacterium]
MAWTPGTTTAAARYSYAIMVGLLVLVGWFHLATLVLTSLFGYFALRKLSFGGLRAVGVALYLVGVTVIATGLVYFTRQAYVTLPQIAETTIPAVVEFAEQRGVELPFTDFKSLKGVAIKEAQEGIAGVGRYARGAVTELASLIIGVVVALSLFLNSRFALPGDPDAAPDSLYYAVSREIANRFRSFYHSFATVIGAQILISAINTCATAVFLIWAGFPHVVVIIGLTFLFGLLPIVGNLLSNTLIIGVGFTISPRMALLSLAFLVIIHKLEYFLNSKIIGDRIKNPMWLTLIGLVVGERTMGIPGMILAPVVLHYLKVETSRARVSVADALEVEDAERRERIAGPRA